MAWNCIIEGKELADVRADRKEAESIEKYKVSKNAVYFEGQYLPLAAITALRVQPSLYYPQCCCGRGVPVFKLRLDCGMEKPLILMVERAKSAERLKETICAGNPAVVVEEYAEAKADQPEEPGGLV